MVNCRGFIGPILPRMIWVCVSGCSTHSRSGSWLFDRAARVLADNDKMGEKLHYIGM